MFSATDHETQKETLKTVRVIAEDMRRCLQRLIDLSVNPSATDVELHDARFQARGALEEYDLLKKHGKV